MSKLFFNRYHISSQKTPDDKKKIFIRGLNKKGRASQNLFAFKIVDLNTTVEGYIIGNLVKYNPYDEGQFVDEDTSEVTDGYVSNRIIAKSFFFIDLKESVLVFEEIRNHLTKQTFIKMFTNLFNSNFEEDFTTTITIDTFKEQYSFVEKVRELKHITKIVIALVPSNPRYSPNWEQMDKKLRDNNITKYREIQTSNKPSGIKIDTETESKMMMSEDGYGESTASGVDSTGKNITFSTKSRDHDISQPLPLNVKKNGFEAILKHIAKTLEEVISRTKKNDEKKNN